MSSNLLCHDCRERFAQKNGLCRRCHDVRLGVPTRQFFSKGSKARADEQRKREQVQAWIDAADDPTESEFERRRRNAVHQVFPSVYVPPQAGLIALSLLGNVVRR